MADLQAGLAAMTEGLSNHAGRVSVTVGGFAVGAPEVAATRVVMIGLQSQGLEAAAARVGVEHLMNVRNISQIGGILRNPDVAVIIRLDGLRGATVVQKLENAIASGRLAAATGRPGSHITNWEIYQLSDAGRLGQAQLMEGGRVVSNPF